ncbi:hypothetical protein D3C73_1026720 [compost metagenome]
MRRQQAGQGGGQHRAAEAFRGADPHGARDQVGPGDASGGLHRAFGVQRPLQQLGARSRQVKPGGRARQQGRLQRRLQPRDTPPDSGRVHAQPLRRCGQRLGAGGGQKHPQIIPIEHMQICTSSPARLQWA